MIVLRTKLYFLAFFIGLVASAQEKQFSFIAFGDMPYHLPEDYKRFENVIKTINAQSTVFSVNVGDIKASYTPCSEASYSTMLNYYQQLVKPMIYVPGDNEWTDCGKKEAGSYDPEERLSVIRKLFFRDRNSLGIEKLRLTSQSQEPLFAEFVENNRWEYQGLLFATVHVVGSNNNFLPTSKNGNKEYYEREKADIAWLKEVFEVATSHNSEGIVIFLHADMFLGGKDLKEASGFNSIKKTLRDLILNFKKPVLLINGDSHEFLIDKPFYTDEPRRKALTNFTRLQVPGDVNMHAVKITVVPSSPSLFQFEELLVPED